jgi:cytochrome c553
MSDLRALATIAFASLTVLAACDESNPGSELATTPDIEAQTDRAAMLALACAGCHSAQSAAMVNLDGYGSDSLRQALLQYRAESGESTVMHRLARGYSDADIDLLAAHFDQERSDP